MTQVTGVATRSRHIAFGYVGQPQPSPARHSRVFALPFSTLFVDKVSQRTKVKSQLLELIKPLNRGVNASSEQKQEIDSLAQQLEKLNPTPKPLASPLVSGKWKLLYTTSASILGTSKPPPFRPQGPIFQIIDAEKLKAKNEETSPFYNQVTADLTVQSNNTVGVQFKEFKLLNLITIKAPPSAVGQLSVTYLDEQLRVSRGDKGNLFILEMDDASVRL